MKAKFLELTLNIMMRMIAGKRYYEESAEELEETKRFKEIVTETFELSGSTNIGDFLPIFKWVGLSGLEKRLGILQGKRDEFMLDLIEELRRIRDSSDFECRAKTMTDVLLSLQEAEPECYTDEIIRGMMLVSFSHFLSVKSETILYWMMKI
nr:isoflavone 2'-hydroxylase [Quercus suber]